MSVDLAEDPNSRSDRRTRGRPGRQARRTATAQAATPAYIQRRIPTYDLLDEESLVRIERTAERILAEVGIDFTGGVTEAIELWRRAGAEVNGENIRFPPGLVA